MSPTRMAQGMMGAHGGNMVAQAPNQSQFMQQFPANNNAMNVNMGQPNTQAAVTQVRQRKHTILNPHAAVYCMNLHPDFHLPVYFV